ncbi:MAG: hypothetical protein VX589_09405 [Myxococcota bacterium]|nr:hypothetical protein [Myxococcota bacterium]
MKRVVAMVVLISLNFGCDDDDPAPNAQGLSPLPDAGSSIVPTPPERRPMTRTPDPAPDSTVTPPTDAGLPATEQRSMDDAAIDSGAVDGGFSDAGLTDALVPTACADGIDNDSDNLVDYPLDPGCMSAADDDETNPVNLACEDELDNDEDGLEDFPDDPGCSSPSDPSEVSQCENAVPFVDMTGQGTLTATTVGGTTQLNVCLNNRAPEKMYLFTLRRPVSRLRIDTVGSSFDTLLAVWRRCDDPSSEVTCNDDLSPGRRASEILLNNPALGDYFILIDGHGRSAGEFTLNIRGELNFGDVCLGDNDPDRAWLSCGTGRLCRDGICQATACADGLDNDGDGQFDFPSEPGCTSRDDDDELDPAIRAECSDGLDNDGDYLIDYPNDPDCEYAADDEEARPPRCRNGRDDDGDNFTDLDDPGCAGDPEQDFEENTPLCQNQIDDDQDNLIDYPNDPGCESIDDTDERDPPDLPECADEIDNDGDGRIDYPDDAESCLSAGDRTEDDPCARIDALDVTGQSRTRGSSIESTNDFEASCAQQTGRESVLVWRLPEDKPLQRLILTSGDSDIDTVVSVRTACAADTEIACNDDDPSADLQDASMSRVEIGPIAGGTDLFILVDGARGAAGIWRLQMRAELAEGANCGGRGQYVCGEGLSCQQEGDTEVCRRPDCDDGQDNDQDGQTDFPFDPGCDTRDDQNEADPLVPPECGNRLDDDQDGAIDFPQDSGCNFAADRSERPDCDDGLDNDGDGQIDFDANRNGSFDGNDDGGCACRLDPREDEDTPCDDGCDNDGDGLIDLDDPGCLNNPNGVTEFNAIQCKDGLDNDGNGFTDYPNDPACRFLNDPIEQSTGPLGECADGIDNDEDGAIDYANGDTGCSSAGDDDERYTCETEIPSITDTGIQDGTTAAGLSETKGSCSIDSGAPEIVYQVQIPYAAQVRARVSDTDFDATVYARSSCWPRSRCPDQFGPVNPSDPVVLAGTMSDAGPEGGHGGVAGGSPVDLRAGQAMIDGGSVAVAGHRATVAGRMAGGTSTDDFSAGERAGQPIEDSEMPGTAGDGAPGVARGGHMALGGGLVDDIAGTNANSGGVEANADDATEAGASGATGGFVGGVVGPGGIAAEAVAGASEAAGRAASAGFPLAGQSTGGRPATAGRPLGGMAEPMGGQPGEPCVADVNTELACNNNPVLFTSEVNFQWSGGPIYVFVDGFGTQSGAFRLTVTATYSEGGQCGPIEHEYARCEAGTTCRANEAVGHPTCQRQ